MTKRAVIYARLSVASSDRSVSIARQLDAGRALAAARGWEVVGEFTDDGVSATANRPEDRAGWSALLAAPEPYDVVVIWRIDRLARRTLDFLAANEVLKDQRGAALVAVDDPLDMSSAQGEAIATVLAAFAQLEAASIRARVLDARRKLIAEERWTGGPAPYGWRTEANPRGAGVVLTQDPERIEHVREMARRVRRGDSLYSVVQWLNADSVPLPELTDKAAVRRKRGAGWSYTSVSRLLHNPVLGGMTPRNPGARSSTAAGSGVVRGPDGLPRVTPGLGIMPPAEWRTLVRIMDERDTPQSRPRARCGKSSDLLSGMVWCAEDGARMWRATNNRRRGYRCPSCSQFMSDVERHVVDAFLAAKGEWEHWSVVAEVHEGGAEVLAEVEESIRDVTARLAETDDEAEEEALQETLSALKRQRRAARAIPSTTVYRPERDDIRTFAEGWDAAADDAERRAVLDDAIERVEVRRLRWGGNVHRKVAPERLLITWKLPDHTGPRPTEDDFRDGLLSSARVS